MSKQAFLRGLGAASALALLAGCGNDPETGQTFDVLRAAVGQLSGGGKAAAAPADQQAQIDKAMAGTDKPLALITVPRRDSTTILTRIEQNGAYDTYATATRQTVTLKHGMITATRGLGGDLMSADVDQSLALVSGRKSGQAQRVMRYLDGEDQTFEYRFRCSVTRGPAQRIGSGPVAVDAVRMTERCTAPSREFENTYLVDGAGRLVGSQQWMGPINGDAELLQLRF